MKSLLAALLMIISLPICALAQVGSPTQFVVMNQTHTRVESDLGALADYFRSHRDELERILLKQNLRLIVDAQNTEYNTILRSELTKTLQDLAEELELGNLEKKHWWSRKARQVKIEFEEVRWAAHGPERADESATDPMSDYEKLTEAQPKSSRIAAGMIKAFQLLRRGAIAIPENAKFLGQQLWQSREMPSKESFLSGLTAKSWPFVTSLLSISATTLPAHPETFLALTGLSFALDTFHGPFAVIWINFQDRLARLKGTAYQTIFNFSYGQAWGYVFKTVAYVGGIGTTSPLSWLFVSVSTMTAIVADFFGAKGFQGLSRLHRLGLLSKTQRDAIVQWRDIPWMIQQTMLYTEKWGLFGSLYILNQGFNVGLWSWSIVGKQQPMLLAVSEETYNSEDFRKAYPEAVRLGDREAPPKWFDLPGLIGGSVKKTVKTSLRSLICKSILK